MKPSSDSLERAVSQLLVATAKLTRRLRVVSNMRELTWSQVAIMARLEVAGPMTTADLARAEAVKPQSMGGTLANMEVEGLVERRPDPTDGRHVLFAFTKSGKEVRNAARIAKQDWLRSAMAELDDEELKALTDAVGLINRIANL